MQKREKNGYDELKEALKTGKLRSFYIFYGEESYLREYSINEIRRKIVRQGLEGFNLTVLEGSAVTLDSLSDAILSYPVMDENKLVILRDFDIAKPPAAMQEGVRALLSDLPEYLCLIASYDTISFAQNKTSPLGDVIRDKASVVNFEKQGSAELTKWVCRRFSALNKAISAKDAEYLIFISGSFMNTLVHEVEKVASYAKGADIRREDIDAVATKALEAQIYNLTDSIAAGSFDKALLTLRELVMMKYDPVLLSGAITRQILRLYSARLTLKEGRSLDELKRLWGMKSSYPAEKLVTSCKSFSLGALLDCLELCAKADLKLKSTAADKTGVLEMLLIRIAFLRGARS